MKSLGRSDLMSSACSQTYSVSSAFPGRRWMCSALHLALAVSCVLAVCQASYGQSTFGTVLGTVKDPSGSLVPMAKVDLLNTGTNVARSTLTKADGAYEFVKVDGGKDKLKV